MEFAQDATWWFSPLHRMTTEKDVLHGSVCHTGFHSHKARRTLFVQITIENQCYHCDSWLHYSIGLRLFMEFAQDVTWWFSPLHRMTPKKGVLQDEVCYTGFHSHKARRALILQNIKTQCCHCDYWLHWCIGFRLFMGFAQDATWWLSPLHKMTTEKDVLHGSVCHTGFHSHKARMTLFVQKIGNLHCHCDSCLHNKIGLRLFIEFAQDVTWWYSPLHRMTTKKGVLQDEVCNTGFHSHKARRALFVQSIENQCCH
jgi:hypothetical protein